MGTNNKGLGRDSNNEPIQITTTFQCQDGHTTPTVSPFGYTTGTLGLTVPNNAYEFIVNPNTLMHISTSDTMANYDEVAASTKESFPCSAIDVIYIRGATVGGTAAFRWHLI